MSQKSSHNTVKPNGHDEKGSAPVFNVHSIYLKDLSFEAPHSPLIFNEEWKPKIDFDLQMASEALTGAEDLYEVVLHLTVTVKSGETAEAKSAFLIDVKQAGVFVLQNLPKEAITQILATTASAVLFPYARETISSLATRGGFPQLVLPPINFDAMYMNHLETQQSKETEAGTTVV